MAAQLSQSNFELLDTSGQASYLNDQGEREELCRNQSLLINNIIIPRVCIGYQMADSQRGT